MAGHAGVRRDRGRSLPKKLRHSKSDVKSGLRQKAVRGLTWTTGAELTEQLLQMVFTAVLARVVTRADLGIVTMALIFNRFAVYMTGMGWGTAVIQAKAIDNRQISG